MNTFVTLSLLLVLLPAHGAAWASGNHRGSIDRKWEEAEKAEEARDRRFKAILREADNFMDKRQPRNETGKMIPNRPEGK
jgi:hypothetical protein